MYEEIRQNKRNSIILVVVFAAVLILLGYIFGQVAGFGYFGIVLAFIISIGMALSGYFKGDKIVQIGRASCRERV